MFPAYIVVSTCAILSFLAVAWYLSDRSFHASVIKKQKELSEGIFDLNKKFMDLENTIADYREKYKFHQESMEDVHDHLGKVTDQMRLLTRGYKVLKTGMIKRYEVLLPSDFKKNIKTLADKMEKLNL